MNDEDPVLFYCDPPVQPPGRKAECDCFRFRNRKLSRLPVLHTDQQDTSTAAWARVLENIERARALRAKTLEPLAGLTGEERAQIVTLPTTIGSLDTVEEVRLYGSHLVRLPPAIGEMASLRYLDVYTSYTLHFAPYELARCKSLRDSRVSTRALYGNYKYRPHFPHLKLPENQPGLSESTVRRCSVCDASLDNARPIRRWITLRLGSDWWPLLVNACSNACLEKLPATPENYVQGPHTGGHHVRQPPREY
jgi:hypothetical protein